jgi:hypothetical protein
MEIFRSSVTRVNISRDVSLLKLHDCFNLTDLTTHNSIEHLKVLYCRKLENISDLTLISKFETDEMLHEEECRALRNYPDGKKWVE